MAPRPRRGWIPGEHPPDVRDAAALLLLYPVEDDPTLVLTERSHDLPQHAGQVSLPGGAVDEGEALEAAALREAREELGVDVSRVEMLGPLTPLHIPVSGFLLHPYVAIGPGRPVFAPEHREVARVAEVPLRLLASPATRHVTTWTFGGRDYEVPYFEVDGLRVWGATAMVLSEFLALLDDPS